MYFLSKYNLNFMVNKKLSRKKIVSKSSKIRTKKVGGGKWKSTKKSLSRGVNRVLAGLGSSKARARRNIRNTYEQSKGQSTNLGSKKTEIQRLKTKKKKFTKHSGIQEIRNTSEKYRKAKEEYNVRKAQLKKESAEKYKVDKQTFRFSRQSKLNSQMESIIQKALDKKSITAEELKTIPNIKKKYALAKNKLKSRYLGLSRLDPYLQSKIRNISKRQSKINVADEYIKKQEDRIKKENGIEVEAAEASAARPAADAARATTVEEAVADAARASTVEAAEVTKAAELAKAADAGAARTRAVRERAADVARTDAAEERVREAEERAVAEKARANEAEAETARVKAELQRVQTELTRLKASKEERLIDVRV
jgi:hypothetical protein